MPGVIFEEDSSKSEREGLEGGSETCCDVWFEGCGTDQKRKKKRRRQEAELALTMMDKIRN